MVGSSNRFIAAVGPATAEALKEKGFHVDYVAKNHTGESLAASFAIRSPAAACFCPAATAATIACRAALREIGAHVTEVIAYRTAAPAALDPAILARIRGGEADAIVFASPSAFHNFRDAIGAAELAKLSQRASNSPPSARRPPARCANPALAWHIEAEEASAAGLAAALAKHYQQHSPAARPA